MKVNHYITKVTILGILASLGPLAMDMYLPAFPAISKSLLTNIEHVQYTFTAYTIGFAIGQILYGPLSDNIGRKKVINFGLILYSVSCLMICFSDNFAQLFMFRLIQSLGAAAIMVTVPARVKDEFSGKEAAKVYSLVMLTMTLAPLIAPFLGSWLIYKFSWHSIFIFMFVVSLITLFFHQFVLYDVPNATIPTGKLFFMPIKHYMVVLKNKEALGYIFCHGFFTSGMLAFIAASPDVYMNYYNISVNMYPWIFACSIAAITLCSYLNTRLVDLLSVRIVILGGALCALTVSALTLIMIFLGLDNTIIIFIGSTIYLGCLGIISPNASALTLALFKDAAGTASAVSGAIRFSLASIATASLGLISIGGATPMFIIMCFSGLLSTLFLIIWSIYPWVKNKSNRAN